MTDGAWIALAGLGFGFLTWLLGISYSLGRQASRLDSVRESIPKIFDRLDRLAGYIPHTCTQEHRLSTAEAKIAVLERSAEA